MEFDVRPLDLWKIVSLSTDRDKKYTPFKGNVVFVHEMVNNRLCHS